MCSAQTTNLAVTPSADAFVRSVAPVNNYGGAGALSVSGSAAVNGSGLQNGLLDSLLRFPMADVANSMNVAFGANHWVLTSVVLGVRENATPNNPVFNHGVGAFEIRWIAANNWVEGTETPNQTMTDGVAYEDVPSLLNAQLDVSLGRFTNSGGNGLVSFPLPLAGPLVSNILAGADVDLYLTAASDTVGVTFNSRNFTDSNSWPSLALSVAANALPRITSIERLRSNQVALRFNTVSNWSYKLQSVNALAGVWTELYTVSAKPVDGQTTLVDGTTNTSRFYRLSVSQ